MIKKESTFIYILLAILIAIVVVQSYLLYDFKKSIEEDYVRAQKSLSDLDSPVLSDSFSTLFQTSSSDPFEHMKKMQEEIHKSFGHFNSFFSSDPFFQKAFRDMGSLPLSDIKEGKDQYKIEVAIPGVKKQQIDIKTSGNVLTIKAGIETRNDINESDYIHMERFTRRFERSFIVRDDADLNALTSNYKDGVLEITIPKRK